MSETAVATVQAGESLIAKLVEAGQASRCSSCGKVDYTPNGADDQRWLCERCL